MKRLFISLILLLVLFSCGKKEENLEAFSAEAFAYDLDNYWEVNISVRVKGVEQIEDEKTGEFISALSYTIDLVHPDSTVEKNKFSFAHSEKKSEQTKDIGLEAQFVLDSTYKVGVYKLVFTITDAHSKKTTSIEKELNLTK